MKTDVVNSLASVPRAIPGKYLMTILQTTAGGNLTFLRDRILYHKDKLLREEQAPDVYQIMDHIAEQVPAGSNSVIYTPWIHGERSPIEDRHATRPSSIFPWKTAGRTLLAHSWRALP
jgi:xylulokinase